MSHPNGWNWFAASARRGKSPPRRPIDWIGSSYARRLHVEALEDRRLLAGVTVGNNFDVVNGNTASIAALIATPGGDGISLREAIQAANATGGADDISFAPGLSGQTILLTGGQLSISETLTIDAAPLAQNVVIDAQQTSRVMEFTAVSGDLTLAGLTMQNGMVAGNGGCILFNSSGTLTLSESTVTGNSTTGHFSHAGGISALLGNVTLNHSTVSENRTTGNYAGGGGIFAYFGAVTLNQCTLSGNSTSGESSYGGGIYTLIGAVTLIQSTFSGNYTEGIDASGGGIATNSGAVTLNQSTLTGNSTSGTNAHGGGIFVFSTSSNPPVTIRNSILAKNSVAAGNLGPDLMADPGGAVIVNYSVIGLGVNPTAGDLDTNIVTDALLLGPLADNGGPTQTHALPPGSAAIDAGDPNAGAVHAYELRGSLDDELGGPSLVAGGGVLGANGYFFDPNQGLNLSTALAADEYSIEIVFSFDTLGDYQKIIDTHNLADDSGLYSIGNDLHFYDGGVGAFAEDVLTANTLMRVMVTRDGPSDVVAVYVNGVQVMSFVDSGDIAVFNGPSQIIRFVQDDNATGGSEAAAGFVDRIRIFDRDLAAGEVAAFFVDQRGAGFPRIVDGNGVSGARIDIGAFEFVPLVVNSAGSADDGDLANGLMTLREAINFANVQTGADVITFDAGMSGQTIFLGGTQLVITESLTIDAAPLAQNVTIDAQQQSRVINFFNFPALSGDLTLAGLTVRNGRTTSDDDAGGGIRFDSNGTLTLTQSTVSENSTTGVGASGGGIAAFHGAVTLNQSTLSGNVTTRDSAKGGGIYARYGAVTLNQSTLTENRTTGSVSLGGGICATSEDVTLNDSTLSGNSTAGDSGFGGGIYAFLGSVTLNQSTVSGNSTAGINARGGGILAGVGDVTLNQSTLSGNRTTGPFARGGGIFASVGDVTLNQSTLTGNSTTGTGANGGGIFVVDTSYNPPLTIRNSILAGNTVAVGSLGPDLLPDPQSAITVNYSLIGTGVFPNAGGNNISTNDPKLGPLANHGGPTQTHALLPGSPAIDAGDPNAGAAHAYEINGSLADALGGPSLVVGGGTLTATGYEFGPNQGLNLSNALAADEYSIELVFSFDTLGGYQKILDFQNLADERGLYSIGAGLHFWDVAFVDNVLSEGVLTHLVVTRDATTDVVAVYAGGVQVLSFVDVNDIAVFNGLSQVIRFFQDDSGGSEAASGFVDRIRVYDHDLSGDEITALLFDQRGPGFDRVVDGNAAGGARMDIGAYERQLIPVLPGDYNLDGKVNAADYTVWRNKSGMGVPAFSEPDGDGDGDVDRDDYNVWKSQYGETVPQGQGAGAGTMVNQQSAANVQHVNIEHAEPAIVAAMTLEVEPAISQSPETRSFVDDPGSPRLSPDFAIVQLPVTAINQSLRGTLAPRSVSFLNRLTIDNLAATDFDRFDTQDEPKFEGKSASDVEQIEDAHDAVFSELAEWSQARLSQRFGRQLQLLPPA